METSLPSFQTATEIQAPATTKERLASAHPLSGGGGCECGFRSCCFSGWNLIQSWKMVRHRVGNQLDSQWSSVHNPVATYADSSCACRSLGTKLQKTAKSARMKNTSKVSGYCRSNPHIKIVLPYFSAQNSLREILEVSQCFEILVSVSDTGIPHILDSITQYNPIMVCLQIGYP